MVGELPLSGVSVTLVGLHFAPEVTGNAPYNTAIADALAAAGAAVHVVTGVPHYPMWRTQAPYDRGTRWTEGTGSLTISRRRHWVPKRATVLGRMLLEATFLAHALPTVWRSKSDIVIAVSPLGSMGAAMLGRRHRPAGLVVQDLIGAAALQSGHAGQRLSGLISRVERRLLTRADRVAIIAPGFADSLHSMGIREDRIALVPNFTHITPVDASPAEARSRLHWPVARFSVVHTGNMGVKQGLETVVEAGRLAQDQGVDVEFVLVGDGNRRAELESLSHGVSTVRFVEPLSETLYPYALAAADVLLVNESAGANEFCLPSKLTSYVVAGRPIVAATDRGSMTWQTVTQQAIAEVVEAGQPQLLLDTVVALQADQPRRDALCEASRDAASAYGRDLAGDRYVQFALSLLRA